MKDLEFIREVVNYYNEHESTLRKTAKHFGISKSSVHHYLTEVFPNPISQAILKKNSEEKYRRGGLAIAQKKALSKKKS